jgi:hypothetical protein
MRELADICCGTHPRSIPLCLREALPMPEPQTNDHEEFIKSQAIDRAVYDVSGDSSAQTPVAIQAKTRKSNQTGATPRTEAPNPATVRKVPPYDPAKIELRVVGESTPTGPGEVRPDPEKLRDLAKLIISHLRREDATAKGKPLAEGGAT